MSGRNKRQPQQLKTTYENRRMRFEKQEIWAGIKVRFWESLKGGEKIGMTEEIMKEILEIVRGDGIMLLSYGVTILILVLVLWLLASKKKQIKEIMGRFLRKKG